MNSVYQITYTKYDIIEFDDKDIIRDGYDYPIEEKDKQEYLQNLMEERTKESYDDVEIIRIGDDLC